MKMVDFFVYFGIAIAVLFVDALFCLILTFVTDIEKDEWFILPLVINMIGFASVLAVMIGEKLLQG